MKHYPEKWQAKYNCSDLYMSGAYVDKFPDTLGILLFRHETLKSQLCQCRLELNVYKSRSFQSSFLYGATWHFSRETKKGK